MTTAYGAYADARQAHFMRMADKLIELLKAEGTNI